MSILRTAVVFGVAMCAPNWTLAATTAPWELLGIKFQLATTAKEFRGNDK